jgi:WD40 repeat protein
VIVWDIEGASTSSAGAADKGSAAGASVQPLRKFAGHTDVVEDVAWHRHHPDIFASCGDDRQLMLWDLRNAGGAPHQKITAHDGDAMSVAFNPFQEFLLVTGGTDKVRGKRSGVRAASLECVCIVILLLLLVS